MRFWPIWNKTPSSRKTRLQPQVLREQADVQSRPQVNREMLPIHFNAWSSLSIFTLEWTSPAKRFPPKTANEKNSFISNKYKKKMSSTSATKTKTNKYVRTLRCAWRTLLKLKNTKNWSTKFQRINTQPIKTKTIKYTHRLRYITSTWIKLLKLTNAKNWTWRNRKQTWTLLKLTNTKNWTGILWQGTKEMNINKYKKLNITEHKTNMNITTNTKKLNSNFMTENKTHEHY